MGKGRLARRVARAVLGLAAAAALLLVATAATGVSAASEPWRIADGDTFEITLTEGY